MYWLTPSDGRALANNLSVIPQTSHVDEHEFSPWRWAQRASGAAAAILVRAFATSQ